MILNSTQLQNADRQQSPERETIQLSQFQTILPLSATEALVNPEQQTTYNRLLPLKFGKLLTIEKLSWSQFKGKVDNNLPWSAHIYWNIQYKLSNDPKPKISVSVIVSPKSWVRQDKKSAHLLNHEHGHLMIAYLCALEFIKHIQQSKISPLYYEYVNGVFGRVLKEFRKIERKYDEETDHRLNFEKQEEWDRWIKKRLVHYKRNFSEKKGRFLQQINES